MSDFTSDPSDLYPLSLSQLNIWDVERACPDTSINNICATLRIQGRVDFSALQRSVNLVLAADGSLRTRITLLNKAPMQYQAAFQPEQIPIYDFSQTSREGIENWESSFTREIMPLFDAPLYRFILLRNSENAGGLVFKMHHLISDGWTQVLLSNRIGQVYLDILSGKEPVVESIPSYQTHVESETRYLSAPAYERDTEYWRKVLGKAGEPSVLKSVRGAAVSPVGNRITFPLPQDLNNDIYSFCMSHRVAPFSVFYMALAIYFKRIGGADRFTIGVPIFNRMNFIAKQTSGMFVSTLPFFSEISGDWTLNEFNDHLNEGWFNMLRHQRLPFAHIQALARQLQQPERLFHIAFSYQNSQLLESKDATVTFSGRWHYSGYQMQQLCIHLSNLEDNRCYAVDYDYLIQLFSAEEIEILHSCLINILREALSAPDRPINQLAVLSPAERERVLYTFNRSSKPIFESSLYGRFQRVTSQAPGRAALICGGARTTYRQLEEQAARVHAALTGPCGDQDALVAVLLPRNAQLLAAMMGILRAGGAFLLLSATFPEARLRAILSQSGAAVLLTTPELGGQLGAVLPIIDVEQLPEPTALPPAEYRPDGLAYVAYTSGSTGAPKGVEICCRSLLNLACAMEPIYGKGAVLSVCSVVFDAFLLESAAALLNGRTILLPSEQELESPKTLAGLIAAFGAGFLSTTPSRLSAFLKNREFEQAIAGIESIVCGGEPFPGDLLQRLQLATKARIYNQYGPSEAAVAVSVRQLNGSPAITAGAPMPNCKLYVLDNWCNPLPIGVYGNLYVGGICVGRGYRNAPELTGESFFDNPFERGGRLYRTGDIACWTPNGEIVLAGRSDRQVKLRGLRIEPQEVSECLTKDPRVHQAAAAVQQHSGQDVLLAFYTSEAPIPEEELLSLCASYLPYYMIPSVILHLPAIPLTANGKLNEALLPRPDLSSGPDAQPETQSQQKLLAIFRRILGRPDFSLDSDYFLFGGNSLNAMESLSEIGQLTGRSLRVGDLYTCRTVRRLALLLEKEDGAQAARPAARLTAAPALERWPLTPIQQGIFVQSHLDPTGKTYNMAAAFRLACPPDIPRLERAFQALIAHEPLLRTAFVSEPDGIFARLLPHASFSLPLYTGATLADVTPLLLAPFRLDHPPLLRAALWQEGPASTVLLLNLHHIIGDGLTTPILLSRLDEYYRGNTPEPSSLSYLDYAWHLSEQSNQPDRLDYWTQRLTPMPEMLELPSDFPRSQAFDFQGDTISHSLSPQLSAACDDFCARSGISPYMFFLAAFGLLLSRLSGKQDLVVGAAASGRLLPETHRLCGPFINTLPLRLTPRADQPLTDYLQAARAEVNGMLDHQQVGQEEIVSALGLKRTLSLSPLFQVIFSQRPVDAAGFTLDGAPLEYIPLPSGTARIELWAELARRDDCYFFQLEYSTQLFLKETAAYFGRCLETLVASMLRPGPCTLDGLEALSLSDRIQLLDIPNNTVYPFLNLPIPMQFDRLAALDPDAPAVIFHGSVTTRRELDTRACQIASLLAAAGAAKGCRIGIAMSRTADLVAAVLGIWKVGGAYAPLLAHYPEQRLAGMVETAGISHVLCDDKTQPQLPAGLRCVQVNVLGGGEDTFQAALLKEDDLAEVLFTSGSTGQPKGVMLTWRSIANMAAGFREILLRSDGPILCTTNVVFDMFNGEAVIPLSMGKPLVMADEEEMMLPWRLAELIVRDGVKITQSTPSRVQMWLSNEVFRRACANLELMIYGGEVLTEALLRQAQTASGEAIQINMYGPTEGTVYNTTRQADYREYVNVGWPMRNNRVYVLDEGLRPVLPTAVGELYLAGECVCLGYISRDDLTQAACLPDPFFPGERMYRTGDIGRLRLDGSYDFLGRRDAQVKLNGQRVELDEINAAFVSEGCALQAATVPVRREDGSMELFTYYIPAPDCPDHREIRIRLGKLLPAYMIPSHIQALDTMPSTPTGKINLRALRDLAESGHTAPASAQPSPSQPAPPTGCGEGPAAAAIFPCVPSFQAATQAQAAPQPLQDNPKAPVTSGCPADVCAQVQQAHTAPPAGPSPCPQSEAAQPASPAANPMPCAHTIAAKAVPAAPLQAVHALYSEPVSAAHSAQAGTLEWIIALWRRVLGRSDVDESTSFFEQGGTSLAALSLLSHYHNSKLTLSLAQFYEQPTARAQAEIFRLSGLQSTPLPASAPAITIVQAPPPQSPEYPSRVPALSPPPNRRAVHTVLLTGATGFLGAHILYALLETGVSRILCTMRDGDRTRLRNTLAWYFGSGWLAGLEAQIEIVRADITRPDLGLTPAEYQTLVSRVDTVWHCAADVRHYAHDRDALLQANLGGTGEMIRLARLSDSPLYHMSTTSVSGDRLTGSSDTAVFTEQDFNIGQDWQRNVYVRSKFLAEAAVFDALRSGLEARVFRLGRLVGRNSDGTFQKNADTNAFWLTCRGIHALGAIPASVSAAALELTPVDWCARAAVALRRAPLAVYHLQGDPPTTVQEAACTAVPHLRVLPDDEFDRLFSRLPADLQGNLLAPVTDLWNRLKRSPPTITVDSSLTAQHLAYVGFRSPVEAPDRLLRAFRFDPAERLHTGGP